LERHLLLGHLLEAKLLLLLRLLVEVVVGEVNVLLRLNRRIEYLLAVGLIV